MLADVSHDRTVVRSLLCEDDGVLKCKMDKNGLLNVESLLDNNSHVSKLVEQAVLGDAIACHALMNDYICVATETDLKTIKQALSLLAFSVRG